MSIAAEYPIQVSYDDIKIGDRVAFDSPSTPWGWDAGIVTSRMRVKMKGHEPQACVVVRLGGGKRVTVGWDKLIRTCNDCGCIDIEGCEGGCGWTGLDRCSSCYPAEKKGKKK